MDTNEVSNDLISLESKHRKEKKELQSQIQALKKAAKNDKTKKKELSAEIAKLEIDLEERHKNETAALEQVTIKDSENTTNFEQESAKMKTSKAQKRREKKQQQEKEREEQIKLQEKENLLGPRFTETQAITRNLQDKGLKIYSIPSDGDCLYKAVAHQMEIKRGILISIDDLRKNVAYNIKEHKEDFIPFLSNPDTFKKLTDQEFEEYCDKIVNTKVWGGQIEIRALSNYLMCPITVIQATGPNCIEQGAEYEGSPLIITYHRHMYSLGEHYNSTQNDTEGEAIEDQ